MFLDLGGVFELYEVGVVDSWWSCGGVQGEYETGVGVNDPRCRS